MSITVKKFRDWGLYWKIMSLSMMIIVITVCCLLFYILPRSKQSLMNEKYNTTRKVVEVAYGIIQKYGEEAAGGQISKADAQQAAMDEIRRIRYDGENYFWINDLEPIMIMHPFSNELEGQDIADFKDPNGKRLFLSAVEVCRKKGEGFVDYYWPKPGFDKPVPKISFVKLYEPWGWVIGTGIYVEDVAIQINQTRNRILAAVGVLVAVTLFLSYLLSRMITRRISMAVDVSRQISAGDISIEIDDTRGADEAGLLIDAMRKMIVRLHEVVAQIQTASDNVASGSEEMSASAEALSQGATEQASHLEEISSSAGLVPRESAPFSGHLRGYHVRILARAGFAVGCSIRELNVDCVLCLSHCDAPSCVCAVNCPNGITLYIHCQVIGGEFTKSARRFGRAGDQALSLSFW